MTLIERYTLSQLRNLLVTPSHKDAYVTAFLTSWAYEKFWIADTLAAVLETHGVPGEEIALAPDHTFAGSVAAVLDRLVPIRNSVSANLIGSDFIAIHMTVGLLEERLGQIVYEGIIEIESGGALSDVVGDIVSQKERHLKFYAQEARSRLAASPVARRLTRLALRRNWLPLSFSAQPAQETRRVLTDPLSTAGSRAKVIGFDQELAALPGLVGTRPASRQLSRLGLASTQRPRKAGGE
ncbi:hypothetical protein LWF01_07265 [Saxibacter everestensis]|uniref:Uncharacterized protein n=1 Tax=Saxibacter everestensis TaxID=2909229 RepID=A0ABY8QWY9_9MICO|nr:hypothetical protein LWF01_07265 [Brevibacteriaceae bacterium ZFBP1038]